MRLRSIPLGLTLFCMTFLGVRIAQAVPTGMTYYVDDDASDDPGPNDPNVSDPLEDGSQAHPFDRIQEALDIAQTPDTVQLFPGTYHEDLAIPRFRGSTIAGSGRSSTSILSVSGSLIDVFLYSYSSPPVTLSLRDVRLAGSVSVVGAIADPNDPITVSLESVDLAGGFIDVHSGFGGSTSVILRNVETNGEISLSASDGVLTAGLDSVSAPTSCMRVGAFFGQTSSSIRNSTLGCLNVGGLTGRVNVLAHKIHFTGSGVSLVRENGEGDTHLDIADSTFDRGGLSVSLSPDYDAYSIATVHVSRSIFLRDGIDLVAQLGIYTTLPVFSSLTVDSCIFTHNGISASVSSDRSSDSVGSTSEINATNNIFDSASSGVKVSYTLPDADPSSPPAALRLAVVNNTFSGCDAGIRIDTNRHIPGRDTVVTLVENNIISRGTTGIEVHGTDDHQFTIAGNDVYGSSQVGYVGDLPDQTGLSGNISADPLFADSTAGDFSLKPASPCIDAGLSAPEVPTSDYNGTPRPQDGNGDGIALPDIGAFEFVLHDDDHDGYQPPQDCNDSDPSLHPGAIDLPGNVADEDCSGQAVCDPSAYWKNHGQFVSCVAQACTGLVKAGSVTQAECSVLVSQAAQSPAGRRQRQRQTLTPQEQ